MSEQNPQTLHCRGVGLGRHHRQVLKGIDCTISPGELTAVIGPNGAGKSSLLACLAGVLPSTAGEFSVNERPCASIPRGEWAKRCAFLPQQESPAWSMPAENLVALGLLPWGRSISRAQRQARVAAALQQVDALDLALRPVTQLSGGELRRVQLARLLVGDAPTLIADEPGAALDIRHQLQLMETFRQQADAGKTVILAIHDLGLAARYCDRVLLLERGQLRAHGTPQEVLNSAQVAEVYGIRSELRWREGRPEFVAGDLI